MRTIVMFFVLASSIAAVGCSKASAPHEIDQAAVGGDQVRFNPKLGLKWPGAPHESSLILPTEAGEEKHYMATFAQKRPEGVIIFSAFVNEFPEEALKGTSPKELLAAHVLGFKKDQTTRKEIEHGSKKHPGLDITTRSGKLFGRKLVVMAGPRLYDVGVTSKNEESLKAPEVKAFFESLTVGE